MKTILKIIIPAIILIALLASCNKEDKVSNDRNVNIRFTSGQDTTYFSYYIGSLNESVQFNEYIGEWETSITANKGDTIHAYLLETNYDLNVVSGNKYIVLDLENPDSKVYSNVEAYDYTEDNRTVNASFIVE